MLQNKFQRRKRKKRFRIHDYTQLESGENYIYEPIGEGERGYLTGQGHNIKYGDYILLPSATCPCQYQVEKIDYYCNQPDIWIALVKKVGR